MRKIADAVREIVEHDSFLRTGLAQNLMNLSQVARHIHSTVEARTQKPVQLAAITMALSRLRSESHSPGSERPVRLAERITVQRGLVVMNFPNIARVQVGLLRLQERVRERTCYLTITEGIRETTLIIENGARDLVAECVSERPVRVTTGVASLSISLTESDLADSGILFRLLQPIALQGINLTEVASTTNEFHLYLAEDDVMLAIDSLYGAFR